MDRLAGFKDTGKRMLATWSEGVNVLRDHHTYALSPWKSSTACEGISDPPKLKSTRKVIGRSVLLAGNPSEITTSPRGGAKLRQG